MTAFSLMKQLIKLTVGVLWLFVSTGCGEPPLDSRAAEKLHYTDPAEQQQLKDALGRAGIRFEVHTDSEGREEVWYESRIRDQVTQIREDVFGVPPPMGRSVSLGGGRNAALVEALKKRNAAYWTVTYRNLEFIAWPPESDEAADASLEAIGSSPHSRIERKKMREAVDAEVREAANRSSRSRAERAPADR